MERFTFKDSGHGNDTWQIWDQAGFLETCTGETKRHIEELQETLFSEETIKSTKELVKYNYSDEMKHYEETYDTTVTPAMIKNPELLDIKSHILYHILIVGNTLK